MLFLQYMKGKGILKMIEGEYYGKIKVNKASLINY